MARTVTTTCDMCGALVAAGEDSWDLSMTRSMTLDDGTGASELTFLGWDLCGECAAIVRDRLIGQMGTPA